MKLVIVSTYPPRLCGIGTFAGELRAALATAAPGWDVRVVAVDRDGLRYGAEVLTVVRQDEAEDYRRAAETIAAHRADLVVIQHEYGIFGGPDGSHVLELADELRLRAVPYVVTLHTVLGQPSRGQEATLAALCGGANRVSVFTRDARNLAAETGVADLERLVVVPHGAPPSLRNPVPAAGIGPVTAAELASVGGRRLITTFGLLGPGKGLENAITAMHRVVRHHPDVSYMIAGATHPEVARQHGESYRQQLTRLASDLGLAGHVRFLNAFLTESELAALLQRTDLFLTPYRSPDQVCSGALTFALVAGCPVLSTAYRYAVEMLTPREGPAPGVLVACDDSAALADSLIDLLADPEALRAHRRAALAAGASLTWPAVANRFAEVFADAGAVPAPAVAVAQTPQPDLCLDHLDRLTDDVGIIQFAAGSTPDVTSGYSIDDAARLAIVAVDLSAVDLSTVAPIRDPRPERWLGIALSLLDAALRPTGMHNLLGHDGVWRDLPHVGDHVGRAVWAVGAASGARTRLGHDADRLLHTALPLLDQSESLRTAAYAILGLIRCGNRSPAAQDALANAARRLDAALRDDGEWRWFEPLLTYDNARLPHALLGAGSALNDDAMVLRALSAMDWYLGQVGLVGPGAAVLRCVGNGWRRAGAVGPSAQEGDEQPIDAAAVVELLAYAWQLTGEYRYARLAQRSFAWFHGANRAGVPVYDSRTGGCRDGLSATSANSNQGAESTLAYYQALLALARADLVVVSHAGAATGADPRVEGRLAHRHRWARQRQPAAARVASMSSNDRPTPPRPITARP